MLMGKYSRKAVALAGVLAVTLIATTAVGLWAGAVGPASTDAALVDPAVAMDHDAGVFTGETSEGLGPATPLNVGSGPSMDHCPPFPPGCRPTSHCCCRARTGQEICW